MPRQPDRPRVLAIQHVLGMLALLALVPMGGCEPGERPPNIVLMIADDQAWYDFGFMGSDVIRTPNLDRLAREGVVFSHGFNTASGCRPSLRTLLTGLNPMQITAMEATLDARARALMDLATIRAIETLPEQLATRGYASFQGGKYWEGSYEDGGFTHGMSQGVKPGGGVTAQLGQHAGGEGINLGRETMEPLFRFIDDHVDDPFFVWFAPSLPHIPHDPEPRYMRPYPRRRFSRAERHYYGNVTRLDARVGELITHLEKRGLRERTLIVFLADNGWDQEEMKTTPTPFLGGPRGKLSIYEIGFRTPIVFSWPGRLPSGRREASLVSTEDLFPTLLDFARVDPRPRDRPGSSLHPLLTGQGDFARDRVIGGLSRVRREDSQKRLSLLEAAREEEAYFLRDQRWRYVWYKDRNQEELFEIEQDPREQNDVVSQHPALARGFRNEIEAWIASMRQLPPGTAVRVGR